MFKISEKIFEDFKKGIEKNKDILGEIKAEGDNGTFTVIASTQSKDRHGEIVLQEGIELENYMENPVILFGHDYWSLPIGKATEVKKEKDKMIIKGVFASSDANPMAQSVRKLYDMGILKAVSIGFIPKEFEGNVITRSELLELSFVPIPANPEALGLGKEFTREEVKEKIGKEAFGALGNVARLAHAKGFELKGVMSVYEGEIKEAQKESKELKATKELTKAVRGLNENIKELREELLEKYKSLEAKVEVGLSPKAVKGVDELNELSRSAVTIANKIRESIKSYK